MNQTINQSIKQASQQARKQTLAVGVNVATVRGELFRDSERNNPNELFTIIKNWTRYIGFLAF